MGNARKNSSFFKIPSCCSKIWRRRRRRRRALRENAIQQHLLTKLEPAQFLCRLVTSSRAESPEHYVPTDDSSQSGNEVPPELNICWTAPSESSKATELSNKMGWYHTAELQSLARLKASSSSPTKNKIQNPPHNNSGQALTVFVPEPGTTRSKEENSNNSMHESKCYCELKIQNYSHHKFFAAAAAAHGNSKEKPAGKGNNKPSSPCCCSLWLPHSSTHGQNSKNKPKKKKKKKEKRRRSHKIHSCKKKNFKGKK